MLLIYYKIVSTARHFYSAYSFLYLSCLTKPERKKYSYRYENFLQLRKFLTRKKNSYRYESAVTKISYRYENLAEKGIAVRNRRQ